MGLGRVVSLRSVAGSHSSGRWRKADSWGSLAMSPQALQTDSPTMSSVDSNLSLGPQVSPKCKRCQIVQKN
eukprot:3075438-Amphidinium_carterae.2